LKCIPRNTTISAEYPKFCGLAHFRGKRTNSTVQLKIPQAAENCGPYWSGCLNWVCEIRVVNIAVLVLLPIVLAILFELAIFLVCSVDMGIGNTFSRIFGNIQYQYFCRQVH